MSRLITMLVDEYDATILLMTATQPRIIDEINPEYTPCELIGDSQSSAGSEYFAFLDRNERVEFTLHESLYSSIHNADGSRDSLSHERTGPEIIDGIESASANVLAISNTVPSARRVAESIARELTVRDKQVTSLGQSLHDFYMTPDRAEQVHAALHQDSLDAVVTDFFDEATARQTQQPDAVTATLTAALRPCDRSLLIGAIRAILDPESTTPFDEMPLIVSSTPLVEAGIDVSFDRIYRDFAPVPSLVQAAGRCNRSFEGSKGEVVLWQLAPVDDHDQSPAVQIYARRGDRLTPSRLALSDVVDDADRVSEFEMITTANQAYYQYLHERDHTTEQTDSLAGAVDDARGETLRKASLIDDDTEEAVVLLTAVDATHLQAYLTERANRNFDRARQSFSHLKQLMVSVRPDALQRIADTEDVVRELVGGSIDELEFDIVDARGKSDVYSIPTGQGVR